MRLPEPIPLTQIDVAQMTGLLDEETQRYQEWYRWDFRATAELVKQLVATRSLGGMALVDGGRVVGYSYFVIDDTKALIGDAYVCDVWASAASERLLLATTLEAVREFSQVRRLESQPMMLRYAYSHPKAVRHERMFLEVPLAEVRWPNGVQEPAGYRIENWAWRAEEDAAQLLYRAYRGHMDSEINDQYRAPGKSRSYLANLIRYPVCGDFCPAASFTVTEKENGQTVGMVLTTVSEQVGHIAQLCVESSARGRGLGRLLLWAALAKFSELGCEYSTLTVTAANEVAIRLYNSAGYVERSRVAAYVWPGWPF
ncbi:GNAT family N-acetyltransferase [Bryobacter aggregatus]|uniref:GNAT family N-acetyltransferase n=1 Tax=Bryobacter aggregatus TaxID=360054 RepID=UPI0004E2732C|nr:GNAT family N-acetyltransferase [Bryobacter aggregatus]